MKHLKGKLVKWANAAPKGDHPQIDTHSDGSLVPSRGSVGGETSNTGSQVSDDSLSRSTSRLSRATVNLPVPPQVRFADHEPLTSLATGPSDMVQLCQLGQTSLADDCRSCIRLDNYERNMVFAHDKLDQDVLGAAGVYGIDALLSGIPQRLQRLSIGKKVALTLLSLANSAWVPQSLKAQDIFLICVNGQGSTGEKLSRPLGPYFLSHTSQNIIQQQVSERSRWHAKSSLFLLGVVLLELFYGQKLDQQQSWKDSLINGEPNEHTMLCSALLWALRAKRSLKEYLGEDVGGSLSDAIRKCISWDFGYDDEYGDAKLPAAVYKELVVPLEKCCPL
jgi:hypothetical protein